MVKSWRYLLEFVDFFTLIFFVFVFIIIVFHSFESIPVVLFKMLFSAIFLCFTLNFVIAGLLIFIFSLKKILNSFSLSLDEPKLVPLQKRFELVDKSTFSALCSLASGSSVFFEWMKDGHKLSTNTNIRIENTDDYSVLSIKNLAITDSGIYECIAKNPHGSTSTSTQLVIKG